MRCQEKRAPPFQIWILLSNLSQKNTLDLLAHQKQIHTPKFVSITLSIQAKTIFPKSLTDIVTKEKM